MSSPAYVTGSLTRNPQPATRNPQPATRNPQPATRSSRTSDATPVVNLTLAENS